MTSALRFLFSASFPLLVTFYFLLTNGMLPSRPALPFPIIAPSTHAPEPYSDEPEVLPREATQSTLTEAVMIPPIIAPLVAGSLSSMPAVVTPSDGGRPTGDPPVVIRAPRMPVGPLPAVLRMPAAKGPFPAVILLHGCNGPFTGMPAWAYRLNAWGYAALMPDSMTPRGVKTVCDPAEQYKVTPWDRVGDVSAAALWLRTRPEIDPARIAVLGLSHGGATAALAVQTEYAGMRLRASIDYYGRCVEPRLHGSVPLLVLAGEADDWGNPASACRSYATDLRPDQPFEIHTYPGVYHGFDAGPATRTLYTGHILQHNQAAADDSFARVHAFLDRWVKP